ARFVDHRVAEPRRAPGAASLRGMPFVGLEDQLGVVVVGLTRAEYLVARGDLVRMQYPLAVIPQSRRTACHPTERLDVADLEERAVDSGDAAAAGRDENLHQPVVIGVADVVTLRLFADDER